LKNISKNKVQYKQYVLQDFILRKNLGNFKTLENKKKLGENDKKLISLLVADK